MALDSGTMILIAVVMGIYFIGMIVISCMGRKYGKNFDDFISAGRNCTTLMLLGRLPALTSVTGMWWAAPPAARQSVSVEHGMALAVRCLICLQLLS